MAPRCPASSEPDGCGPTWNPSTHRAAFAAAGPLPTVASDHAASPVLLVFGLAVLVPPMKEPFFRCCRASQAAAFSRAPRSTGCPLLDFHSWITAYDVASGSAGLFGPQPWCCAFGLLKFRRK